MLIGLFQDVIMFLTTLYSPLTAHQTIFARRDLYSLPGFHDPVSAMTHLFAAPMFLVLSFFLLCRGRGNTARLIFLGIFAFATVFLLSMSGVYHMMESGGNARVVMERLDHSAIFVLIA